MGDILEVVLVAHIIDMAVVLEGLVLRVVVPVGSTECPQGEPYAHEAGAEPRPRIRKMGNMNQNAKNRETGSRKTGFIQFVGAVQQHRLLPGHSVGRPLYWAPSPSEAGASRRNLWSSACSASTYSGVASHCVF